MIISIINQKGGVGKTTTAVSLASRFAKMEYKTLLVDLDEQANACLSVGKASDIPQITKIKDYLDLLAECEFNEIDELAKMLPAEYEFKIIDCPPVLNLSSANAIYAADLVIVPVLSGDFYSLAGLKKIFQTVNGIKQVPYKILITNVNERLSITKHFYKILIDSIGEENIFKNIIRIDSKLKEAPFAGVGIDLYDVNSKGAIDYGDLTIEIINLKEEA